MTAFSIPADSFLHFKVKMRPRGKGRPRFGRGHAYTDSETRAAEQQIAWAAKAAGARMRSEPCQVSITAYFKPSMTEEKQKKGKPLTPYLKKPDSDNILKLCCDSLNGVAWDDDVLVYDASIKKLYGEEDCLEIFIQYR